MSLELWSKVEKTNPKYTKKANVKGNQITSIAPQYQIKNVTEQFGVYGKTWGFKSLEFDYTLKDLGLVVLHAVFFFPDGEFPIKNAQALFIDNAKTKVDDNFAKKLETDTLTKAISKLGFNADIFLGLFDDVKYLNDVTLEFNPPPPPAIPILNEKQLAKLLEEGNISRLDLILQKIENKELSATSLQTQKIQNRKEELTQNNQ